VRTTGCGTIKAPQAVSRAVVLLQKCELAADAILSLLHSEGCDTLLTKPELVKMIYGEVSEGPFPLLRSVVIRR
jgi:hypothetical protein